MEEGGLGRSLALPAERPQLSTQGFPAMPDPARNDREGEAPAEPTAYPVGTSYSPPGPSPTRFRPGGRHHPAHGVLQHTTHPPIVFLTVCTRDRGPWLATPAVHDRLHAVWLDARAWLVGRYVVMPDHVHLFAGPGDPDFPFDRWVRYWKSQFTKRHETPAHAWQTDHWDRRLRTGESYGGAWEYILANPVRKGLVSRAEDWPFQGELFELRWD